MTHPEHTDATDLDEAAAVGAPVPAHTSTATVGTGTAPVDATVATSDGRDPVVLCVVADEPFALGIAVTVQSILAHRDTSRPLQIWVLGTLEDATRERLLRTWDGPELTIQFLRVTPDRFDGFPTLPNLPQVVYTRLLIPHLLPADVHRALYIDVDTLVRRDVGLLYDADLGGHALGAIVDDRYSTLQEGIGNWQHFDLPAGAPYYNSGVLLFDLDQWRSDDLTERCMAFIAANAEHLVLVDQESLNVFLVGHFATLDRRWNVQTDCFRAHGRWLELGELDLLHQIAPWVVHFTWVRKPWRWDCRHPYRDEWRQMVELTDWKGWQVSGGPNLAKKRYEFFMEDHAKLYRRIVTLKKRAGMTQQPPR
jgi:lipopolysaccharide biosynthesis glycosyltransferase